MNNSIDTSTFDRLVKLAALEMTPSQAAYLRRELNNQLKAIAELEAIPLDEAIVPVSHGIPYTDQISPPLRDDVWAPYPDPDAILSQAPEMIDRHFSVPDTAHADLD
jgi:aspartyl/glutamyl-tRNA(Asn/Gln) amidotransferase C subunit